MSTPSNSRDNIIVLAERCPAFAEPAPTCPLSRLRAEPDPSVRAKRIADMTEEEIRALRRHHLECLCRLCGN